MRGHIKKRADNTWSVVIYLGIDPITDKKKYKWYTVKGSENDAEVFLTEKLRQLDTNTYADPGKLSIKKYLERWVKDYCELNLAQNTLVRYKGIVDNHIVPAIGSQKIGKLQPLEVQEFYSETLKTGRKDGKGKTLSPSSVRYIHCVLHEALHHAVEWNILSRNICDSVKPPKVFKRERKTLDKQSLYALFTIAKGTPMHVPIYLTVHTGMRRGEFIGLEWKNVDLKAGIIYVKQAMEYDRGEKKHKLKIAKNEESRRIDITEKLVNILTQHKKDQKNQRKATKGDCEINDYVCTMANGKVMALDYCTKSFGRLAKKCHIDITLHELRHTHATILASLGVSVKAIAERLGNDPVVTMGVYSHVTPSIQREIVTKLDEYFADDKTM